MYVKVKNAMTGDTALITLSKLTLVEELRDMIKKKMEVEPAQQRLFFQGKQMEDEHTMFDYNLKINDIIQLMIRQPLGESQAPNLPQTPTKEKSKTSRPASPVEVLEKAEEVVTEVESEFYKKGDLVDILDTEEGESAGGWFEGIVSKITKEEGENVVAGNDGLTYHVKYEEWDDLYKNKIDNLRPRARKFYKSRELEVGMEVMVNYNISQPDKRGMWHDATVDTVRPLVCTVKAGLEQTPVPDCAIVFQEEVMRIEKPVRVEDRTEKDDKEMNTAVARKHPEKCEVCHDSEKKKCKECGCRKCGGKGEQDEQVMCDECDGAYHFKCLGLKALPDEDEWYCPECKNDDDIVKIGEKMKVGKKKAKMPSNSTESKRDWGKGFACAGRSKECKVVDKDHFGPIPGIEVGINYFLRIQISEEGIHRPPVAGIAGTAKLGCPSLVLSGGYEDDVDNGEEFYYTGAGGRDLSGNKRTAEQSFDQELTKSNGALALNCDCKFDDKNGGEAKDWRNGKPIRVVRGYKGAKHSKYAPELGNRYDGIYKVVKYWPEKGKSGFRVWRYLIRRDDPIPAPWTNEGKKRIEEGGYGEVIYPEGYHEAQAEKEKEKAAKEAEKQRLKKEAKAAGIEKSKSPVKNEKKGKDAGKENKGKAGKKRKADEEETVIEPQVVKKAKVFKEEKAPKSKFKPSSDILQAMDADQLNKKLWDEVKSTEYNNKKEMNDFVENQFCCIICQDVVFQPVTTPCLHNVCKPCLERSFKAEVYTCSSCRGDLGKDYEKPINKELKDALNMIFPGYETGR